MLADVVMDERALDELRPACEHERCDDAATAAAQAWCAHWTGPWVLLCGRHLGGVRAFFARMSFTQCGDDVDLRERPLT